MGCLLSIQYAYFSIIGNVRMNHEDNYYVRQMTLPMNNSGTDDVISGSLKSSDRPLIGVFDGMGGECFGEAAAFIAADTMYRFDTDRLAGRLVPAVMDKRDASCYLNALFQEMNREVCSYAKEKGIHSMGTTAACVLFMNHDLFFANVGDSRIYRGNRNKLTQITTDQVSRSVFFAKPPLIQYLGMNEETALLPQLGTIPINPEEYYFLCTDGVTDMLKDDEILKILSSSDNPRDCLIKLRTAVLSAGAKDNATAVLCLPVQE